MLRGTIGIFKLYLATEVEPEKQSRPPKSAARDGGASGHFLLLLSSGNYVHQVVAVLSPQPVTIEKKHVRLAGFLARSPEPPP